VFRILRVVLLFSGRESFYLKSLRLDRNNGQFLKLFLRSSKTLYDERKADEWDREPLSVKTGTGGGCEFCSVRSVSRCGNYIVEGKNAIQRRV
jgi:hypothetical protein